MTEASNTDYMLNTEDEILMDFFVIFNLMNA